MFIIKFNNEFNFSRQIIKFDGKILNNHHQSFDSHNIGDKACFDVIINKVILKLIPKVSVNIEGVTYVVEELKRKQCVVYPTRKKLASYRGYIENIYDYGEGNIYIVSNKGNRKDHVNIKLISLNFDDNNSKRKRIATNFIRIMLIQKLKINWKIIEEVIQVM